MRSADFSAGNALIGPVYDPVLPGSVYYAPVGKVAATGGPPGGTLHPETKTGNHQGCPFSLQLLTQSHRSRLEERREPELRLEDPDDRGADRTREPDGLLLGGDGARYEGVDLGAGRDRTEGRELEREEDRTDGRETVRWEVDLDLETEGLAWLRGARLVTDPRDPDEDREILRLGEEGRDDFGVRFGVRLTLGPDCPLDRELGRWRVKVPEGLVRLGRVTNDGWDEVRPRELLETFPGAATGGIDDRWVLRLVNEPLDPDEDRERLRLGAVERVVCGARVGVRTTFTPDRPLDRDSGRCRTNDLVDPVRSERVTADRREGTRTAEASEPLLATPERREPVPTRRSRVLEADLEERTPLLE